MCRGFRRPSLTKARRSQRLRLNRPLRDALSPTGTRETRQDLGDQKGPAPQADHTGVLMVSPRSPPIFLHYSETPRWEQRLPLRNMEGLDPTEKEQKGRK